MSTLLLEIPDNVSQFRSKLIIMQICYMVYSLLTLLLMIIFWAIEKDTAEAQEFDLKSVWFYGGCSLAYLFNSIVWASAVSQDHPSKLTHTTCFWIAGIMIGFHAPSQNITEGIEQIQSLLVIRIVVVIMFSNIHCRQMDLGNTRFIKILIYALVLAWTFYTSLNWWSWGAFWTLVSLAYIVPVCLLNSLL